MSPNLTEPMNLEEASKWLKTPVKTLRRLVMSKKIPAFRVGGQWRVIPSQIVHPSINPQALPCLTEWIYERATPDDSAAKILLNAMECYLLSVNNRSLQHDELLNATRRLSPFIR